MSIANIKRYAMRNIKLKPIAQQTEIDKRVKLAEEMAKEVSQIKPIADVAKDLADHVDEIVLAKMIETAKNK